MQDFLVSIDRDFWIPGLGDKFCVDPFIEHSIRSSPSAQGLTSVHSAPYRRARRADFERDMACVRAKYERYRGILIERLNSIHGSSYPSEFWLRTFGLGLLRLVACCFEAFHSVDGLFDPARFEARLLARSAYQIPFDFYDAANFWRARPLGQEQLFSIYVDTFFPGEKLQRVEKRPQAQTSEPPAAEPRGRSRAALFLEMLREARADRRVAPTLLNRLRRRGFDDSKITVAVMGSYFSRRHFLSLENRSRGKIRAVDPAPLSGGAAIDFGMRDALSAPPGGADRFDRYFFAAIRFLFPKLLLEDFKTGFAETLKGFERFPSLKAVVCESFISGGEVAFQLAVLRLRRNVAHIYNEHNFLGHFYLGDWVPDLAACSDFYVTMGWSIEGIPNLVRGASLFSFVEPPRTKRYEALLVMSAVMPKVYELTAATVFGENAGRYLEFMRKFLNAVPAPTAGRIAIRGYPKNISNFQQWDLDQEFRDEYARFARTATDEPSRALMRQSGLVIVTYQSTSHLESMLMGIPTVVFWCKEIYLIKPEYEELFSVLEEAGILQTDPVKAAAFVESILEAPERWWNAPRTRTARERFLKENFGAPKSMYKLLLQAADGDSRFSVRPWGPSSP